MEEPQVNEPTQEELWIQADAGDALMRERAAERGYDQRTPRERREDAEAIERYQRR